MKSADRSELLKIATAGVSLASKNNSLIIINDHAEIAAECGADGVHLGLNDMSINEARSIAGQDAIIGGTANSLEHVLQRINDKADYVGLGPFRFTSTKQNLSPVLGIHGVESIMNELARRGIDFPVYVIGGIKPEDVGEIMQTGVAGVAVSSAINYAEDASAAMKNFMQTINQSLYGHVEDRR